MSDHLSKALGDLVSDGVLTDAQATAVRTAVANQQLGETEGAPARRSGLAPAGEIAAWVGAILAGAAGLTAATRFWAELEVWAQTALLLVVAVTLFFAGRLLLDDDRGPARRITGVTWLACTLAFAAAVWVPMAELVSRPEALPFLAAAGAATVLAFGLWRASHGALQLISVFVAVVVALLSGLALPERPPSDLFGLLVWAMGVALVMLAWAGLVTPRRTGLVIGALAMLVGAETLQVFYARVGVLLGLLTVAALFALGGGLSDVAMIGMAAAGLAVFVPQALGAFFPGSLNASATMFIAGVLVLAGALVTLRAARETSPAAHGWRGQP